MKGHIEKRGGRSWRLKFDVGRDPATGNRLTRCGNGSGFRVRP